MTIEFPDLGCSCFSLGRKKLLGTEPLFEGDTELAGSGARSQLLAVQAGRAAIQLEVTYGTELFCRNDDGSTGYEVGPDHTVTSGSYVVDVSATCPGDCDGNGSASIDELVRGVDIALGTLPLAACSAFDHDRDGEITIDELIQAVSAALSGCAIPTPTPAPTVHVSFDFRDGFQGWMASFSDYSQNQESYLELQAGIEPLPPEVSTAGMGLLLSGNNYIRDLFMFLTRQLTSDDGVVPSRQYTLSYTIRFASNAPTGCTETDVGGVPGESVFLKAGGSTTQPLFYFDVFHTIRLTVDKGDQGEGGPAASVVSNIANDRPCDAPAQYVTLAHTHVHPFPVQSNVVGQLWLLIGTDSGFGGTTSIYYESIDVTLVPE